MEEYLESLEDNPHSLPQGLNFGEAQLDGDGPHAMFHKEMHHEPARIADFHPTAGELPDVEPFSTGDLHGPRDAEGRKAIAALEPSFRKLVAAE